MYYKVLRFIKHLPYNIRYGIKNLIKWFPVVWKDRDWDQIYLYKSLHFKLKNMEHLHRTNAHYIGSEKEAHNIRVCKLLLERLIDDVYYDKVFMQHDKKWGDYVIGKQNTFDGSIIPRENIKSKEDFEKEKKEKADLRFSQARELEKAKKEKAARLFEEQLKKDPGKES